MATATDLDAPDNLAEMLNRLGNVPPERIRVRLPLGCATEEDVIAALELPDKRLCELIDAVLVEKPTGIKKSVIAGLLVHYLWNCVEQTKLGFVFPSTGAVRLFPQHVRIPDVSFIRRDRLPNGKIPMGCKLLPIAPDLAVDVLTDAHTSAEIARKLLDYFKAGVKLVWLIDLKTETARAHTSPKKSRLIDKDGTLTGGKVLPGFSLSLKELFARTRRRKPKSR